MSAHGAARPLGHMCLEANGWKVWPTLASLAFERGCRSVCPAPPRGVQGALAAWSLNRVRHVPVVACLSQENLSYWIWKSLKHSGRPGCLLFMPILRLLSFCSARPGHGCSEWDQDEAICMEFSPGDSGDFSQGSHFPRQQALERPVLLLLLMIQQGERNLRFSQPCSLSSLWTPNPEGSQAFQTNSLPSSPVSP